MKPIQTHLQKQLNKERLKNNEQKEFAYKRQIVSNQLLLSA